MIRFRFDDAMIEKLMKIDYSALTKDMIAAHEAELYTKLESGEQLAWLPTKDEFAENR